LVFFLRLPKGEGLLSRFLLGLLEGLLLEHTHYLLGGILTHLELVFFLAFLNQYNHLANSGSTRATEPLYHANGRREAVVTDDQIYIANVKSFLRDARGHQNIALPSLEFVDKS
jgi:hypothetical protein